MESTPLKPIITRLLPNQLNKRIQCWKKFTILQDTVLEEIPLLLHFLKKKKFQVTHQARPHYQALLASILIFFLWTIPQVTLVTSLNSPHHFHSFLGIHLTTRQLIQQVKLKVLTYYPLKKVRLHQQRLKNFDYFIWTSGIQWITFDFLINF